jgi:hypothetical protein
MSDVGIIAVLFTALIFATIIIYRTGGTQHDRSSNEFHLNYRDRLRDGRLARMPRK